MATAELKLQYTKKKSQELLPLGSDPFIVLIGCVQELGLTIVGIH